MNLPIEGYILGGERIDVNTPEELQDIYEYIGSFLRLRSRSKNTVTTASPSAVTMTGQAPHVEENPLLLQMEGTERKGRTPVGERVIDYAVKAAEKFAGWFSVRDLAAAMLRMGWKTKSTSVRSVEGAVRSELRRSGLFETDGEGKYRLKSG